MPFTTVFFLYCWMSGDASRSILAGTAMPGVNASPTVELAARTSKATIHVKGPRKSGGHPSLYQSRENGEGPPAPQEKKVYLLNQEGVEPPIFTKKVAPNYPWLGRINWIQGYVILSAILGKDGTIRDIKVLRGLGDRKYGFEKKAVAALKKWKYKPGKINGQPADIRMTLKINFVLE